MRKTGLNFFMRIIRHYYLVTINDRLLAVAGGCRL